ncbi:FlgB family protein [Phaeovulum vinaykumarii]|uniref:Flagellar basal body rod protein FlgB n=1 Tax=Phaeovulum vinaykumarii TaxID=407234 RepID=A0A1N7KVG2_9RHOB|nr:FlgB family protein [Phaeovulum vinaykumarii]SIS65531.1 flagellar basal-body rod protein FlgB [Phaeovulum vinaykumarii]SOC01249.1 flagellar basal-body rod protein FlgB [Phaeovulum vinaykumarii]
MFDKLDVFRIAQASASHAALRLNAVSQNIANADTPGYRARDVAPFAETYRAEHGGDMRATRAGHLGASSSFEAAVQERQSPESMSPNGNSVSLEAEMVTAVDVQRQHDRALSVYKSSLDILRMSIGRK